MFIYYKFIARNVIHEIIHVRIIKDYIRYYIFYMQSEKNNNYNKVKIILFNQV